MVKPAEWRSRYVMLVATVALFTAHVLTSCAWAAPELVRDAPQVWNVTPNAATIAWFTNSEGTAGTLEYGVTAKYGTQAAAITRRWPLLLEGGTFQHHVATISGLKPNTRYFYRASSNGIALAPATNTAAAEYSFVTAHATGDTSEFIFAVLGDGGEGNKYQRAITRQMEQVPFDFLIHTGDVVYDDGTDGEWHLNYYPIYKNLIRNRPWYLTPGNHEYLDAPSYYVVAPPYAIQRERLLTAAQYESSQPRDPAPLKFKSQSPKTAEAYFENAILPTNSGTEKYYSFDWGPVHFVMLDSNRSSTPGAPGDAAYQWLANDLAQNKSLWKVVCLHHPMAAIGKPEYAFTTSSATALRRDWHPLFEKYGVDVVFSGHDHNYQRTYPITVNPATGAIARDDAKGIVHIVTGGGGGGLTDQSVLPAPAWHSGKFFKRHHFLQVKVAGNKLHISVIADDNIDTRGVTEKAGLGGPAEVLETVVIEKRPQAK